MCFHLNLRIIVCRYVFIVRREWLKRSCAPTFLLSVAVLRAEEHLAALNQRVPAGFSVVAQPPFVVIGHEAPGMVRSRATNTVKRGWIS